MNVGNQVIVTDGAFLGFTGIVTKVDREWVLLTLRDGGQVWLAASICRLVD